MALHRSLVMFKRLMMNCDRPLAVKRLTELHRDTTVLGNSLRQMTGQYDKINSLNNELLEKYNKLLAGDRSES